MSIRETINNNPAATGIVAIAIVVVALVAAFWPSGSGRPDMPKGGFFSDDDGNSYFTDALDKIAPFDHDGKTAYKAHVFAYKGQKPFVAVLERYTPKGKKAAESYRTKLEELRNKKDASPPAMSQDMFMLEDTMMKEVEVKKPGDGKWLNRMDPAAMTLFDLKLEAGSLPEPVFPQ